MRHDRRLPDELRQALVNYLAMKPYHEVYQLIPQLETLPIISQPMQPMQPSMPDGLQQGRMAGQGRTNRSEENGEKAATPADG